MRAFLPAAALLLASGALAPAPAAAAPGGSYRQSCRAVQDLGRNRIAAECRDRKGRWRDTSLNLRDCAPGSDIGNDNGRLACAPGDGRPGGGWGGNDGGGWGGGGRLPGGSWAQSCRDGDVRRGVLTASCADGRGRDRVTSLTIRQCPSGRAGNSRGRLVCE